MLKKINVEQIKLGMHLKEFCGSWMEHPFWRNGFVLTDAKDIEVILASSIKEVWIDCDKGIDVAPGETTVSEADSDAQVDASLAQVVLDRRNLTPLSTQQELAHAAKICLQAKRAVISMFEEARMGKAVDTGGAQKLVEEITDSVARTTADRTAGGKGADDSCCPWRSHQRRVGPADRDTGRDGEPSTAGGLAPLRARHWVIDTENNWFWWLAWSYRNHVADLLLGEHHVVTPHGWIGLFDHRAAFDPLLSAARSECR